MNNQAVPSGTKMLAAATPVTTPIFPRAKALSARMVAMRLKVPPSSRGTTSFLSSIKSWRNTPLRRYVMVVAIALTRMMPYTFTRPRYRPIPNSQMPYRTALDKARSTYTGVGLCEKRIGRPYHSTYLGLDARRSPGLGEAHKSRERVAHPDMQNGYNAPVSTITPFLFSSGETK